MKTSLLSQLAEYPEWQERVKQAMQLPPFEMNYSPLVTEVFDQQGLLVGEVLGSIVYEGQRNINEPSKFIAWFFDGKLGVFCWGNQVIVNRLHLLATVYKNGDEL
ncbi:hypothetical protein NUACC21_54840 [Scytonema sp. NUACC21]|jgi:hypothetical protein